MRELYYSDTTSNFKFDSNSSAYASEILVVSGGGKRLVDFAAKLHDLDQKIKAIEDQKKEIRTKMEYMKQSGSETFNEKEYKAYSILQTIKQGGMNDFEKAKLISELIK
jgi:predicted  nucleic acid-binding Zn-ribbon protein